MDLKKAATYFSNTLVAGWNVDHWVDDIALITLMPWKDRLTDSKRREMLIQVDDIAFDTYPVIKIPGSEEIYMVGLDTEDVSGDGYCRSVLLHRANYLCSLFRFDTTNKASGMPGPASRTLIGKYWGDIERDTSMTSKEFGTRFTGVHMTLSSDCPAATDQEFAAGAYFYALNESFFHNGFRQCRGFAKTSMAGQASSIVTASGALQ